MKDIQKSLYLESTDELKEEDLQVLIDFDKAYPEQMILTKSVAAFDGNNKGFRIDISLEKPDIKEAVKSLLDRLFTTYAITVTCRNKYGEERYKITAKTTNIVKTMEEINWAMKCIDNET